MSLNNKFVAPNTTAILALAAVAVVGAGIIYFLLRGNGRDDAKHEVTLVAPRDGATVTSPQSRFRWQTMATATAYHVFVYEVNRTPVWSALTRDTSLVIPVSLELQRGQSYLWRVEAIFPDETTADSELRAFMLSE